MARTYVLNDASTWQPGQFEDLTTNERNPEMFIPDRNCCPNPSFYSCPECTRMIVANAKQQSSDAEDVGILETPTINYGANPAEESEVDRLEKLAMVDAENQRRLGLASPQRQGGGGYVERRPDEIPDNSNPTFTPHPPQESFQTNSEGPWDDEAQPGGVPACAIHNQSPSSETPLIMPTINWNEKSICGCRGRLEYDGRPLESPSDVPGDGDCEETPLIVPSMF